MAMIRYTKLNEFAQVPTRGSLYSAGYDLYAAIEEPITIQPYTVEKIGTGLSFQLPPDRFAGIFARSGLATKRGLRPANCVGVCDCDYTGEYIIALYNDSDQEQIINPGDRVAQMILLPFDVMTFKETERLEETERGNGGFGSTGE